MLKPIFRFSLEEKGKVYAEAIPWQNEINPSKSILWSVKRWTIPPPGCNCCLISLYIEESRNGSVLFL